MTTTFDVLDRFQENKVGRGVGGHSKLLVMGMLVQKVGKLTRNPKIKEISPTQKY